MQLYAATHIRNVILCDTRYLKYLEGNFELGRISCVFCLHDFFKVWSFFEQKELGCDVCRP